MKFIFIIIALAFLPSMSSVAPASSENCSGVSFYCSCETTCNDDLTADCYSGLTCSCACRGEDVKIARANPTMNSIQQENSEKAEAYFITLGYTELADGLKGLREDLIAKNFEVYHSEAAYVQAIFDTLSERERAAYDNWAAKTLDVLEE